MSEYRIIATISPVIYEDISKQTVDIDNFFVFFKEIMNFAEHFQHFIIFIFPKELTQFFTDNSKLRILYDKNKYNSESNIWFREIDTNCSYIFTDENKNKYNNIINKLLGKYSKIEKYTILVDYTNYKLHKTICSANCNTCIIKTNQNYTVIKIDNNFEKKLEEYGLNNAKEWIVNKDKFTLDDLKQLVYFYALTKDVSKKDLEKFNKVKYIKPFENDIKKIDNKTVYNLATSVFRGTVYASFGTSEATELSLDIHHHNYGLLQPGETFWGIDVVPPEAISQSGKKRVFKAIINNETYVLMYDKDHGDNLDKKIVKSKMDTARKM